MFMRNIMNQTNDINKYCSCARAQQQAQYSRVATGGNNPSISQKMRYSQYLRQSGVTCKKPKSTL